MIKNVAFDDPITGPEHPIYTELCVQYEMFEYLSKCSVLRSRTLKY